MMKRYLLYAFALTTYLRLSNAISDKTMCIKGCTKEHSCKLVWDHQVDRRTDTIVPYSLCHCIHIDEEGPCNYNTPTNVHTECETTCTPTSCMEADCGDKTVVVYPSSNRWLRTLQYVINLQSKTTCVLKPTNIDKCHNIPKDTLIWTKKPEEPTKTEVCGRYKESKCAKAIFMTFKCQADMDEYNKCNNTNYKPIDMSCCNPSKCESPICDW